MKQTLRATVVPKNASKEQFAAFLVVANEYGLNPLTKEIYAFPTSGGGIQPIVSVDGWANLINRQPACDGIEFDDHLDSDGKVASITARIWRKDRNKPTTVTEYLAECHRQTDAVEALAAPYAAAQGADPVRALRLRVRRHRRS